MKKIYTYIGNWHMPKQEIPMGVAGATYENGSLRVSETQFPELNFGQACVDTDRGILYCVNERPEVAGQHPGGQIFALKIDPETGLLSLLNKRPSFGPLPSDCAIDSNGKYLIVSNHSGRNCITKTVQDKDGKYRLVREYDETAVVLFSLSDEGEIGEPCHIVRHAGSGALPNQQSPHAHCVRKAPGRDLFVVCDKGNDSVYTYRIDPEKQQLICCDRLDGVPGSSPRYCVFHPELPLFYYNNETKSIVNVVQYTEEGKMQHIGAISCMEDGNMEARGLQSDLQISRDGRYLYTLVRDNSTIAVFELDANNGYPALVQVIFCGSSQGGRGLSLAPDGNYLFVAACPDQQIIRFSVGNDGRLSEPFVVAETAAPGVVLFVSSEEA